MQFISCKNSAHVCNKVLILSKLLCNIILCLLAAIVNNCEIGSPCFHETTCFSGENLS